MRSEDPSRPGSGGRPAHPHAPPAIPPPRPRSHRPPSENGGRFSLLRPPRPCAGRPHSPRRRCLRDQPDVATSLKHDLIITHPVVEDPTDYKGMPAVVQGDGGPTASFLPFGELNRMLSATVPTVVMMDDLGQAPPAVQAAVMQLILARQINGRRISDHVSFIAATNRREDRAEVPLTGPRPVSGRPAVVLTPLAGARHLWASGKLARIPLRQRDLDVMTNDLLLGLTTSCAKKRGFGRIPRATQDATHDENGPAAHESDGAVSRCTACTEAEGLEPPRACARRISSAVPYQLDYASNSDISRDGRI